MTATLALAVSIIALILIAGLIVMFHDQVNAVRQIKKHCSDPEVQAVSTGGVIPKRAHREDAGLDLRTTTDIRLVPGERALINTGISVGIPAGYVGLVAPRSGLAHKHGITIMNSPGVVDAGYHGDLFVNVVNHGSSAVTLRAGDRIAQLLIVPAVLGLLRVVDDLGESDRGMRGHGSTGVK